MCLTAQPRSPRCQSRPSLISNRPHPILRMSIDNRARRSDSSVGDLTGSSRIPRGGWGVCDRPKTGHEPGRFNTPAHLRCRLERSRTGVRAAGTMSGRGDGARAQLLSRTARLIALIQSPTPDAAGQAASLGFAGLASTDITPRALERTIAAVIHGENAFPRRLLTGLVQMISRLSSAGLSASGESALTPRQGQIVELIAQGATDREIAGVLRISQSTAHKHVQNALRRLNARTRSQLVAAARQPLFPRSLTH